LRTEVPCKESITVKLALDQHHLADVLTAVLHEVVRGARRAGADLTHLKATLEQRQRELEAPLEQMALRAAVASLIGDTENVQVLTGELIERMERSAREVQSLRARLQQAETDALLDPLTGLANRRGFERDVASLQQARGSLASCAVLFIDIDHFKSINDLHGHALGDRVLREVAALIRESIKGRDIAARLGGEEFVVLLTDTTIAGAWVVGEQLRDATARCSLRRQDGQPIERVTMSIGVAMANVDEAVTTLVERADAAMYRAKRSGRDCITCDEAEPEASRNAALERRHSAEPAAAPG
jgi:diguanylate cyclase